MRSKVRPLKEFLFLFFVLNILLIPTDIEGITKSEVMIKFDKESYSPFNRVNISVITSDSNTDSMKADKVYVDIRTKNASLMKYELAETNSNSGNFTGYITLSGPNGITEGKGPLDGRLTADRGEELLVSFTSSSEEQITARAEINYQVAKIFFDKNYYKAGDDLRAILVDEDLNTDPKKLDVSPGFVLTSSFMRGVQSGGFNEESVNSGKFVIFTRVYTIGDIEFGIVLKPKGETLITFYRDLTVPEPYAKIGSNRDETKGIWIFAIAPFLGASTKSDTIPSAPLFIGDDPTAIKENPNFIVKTLSAIQSLRILEHDNKMEFVNVASEEGIIEMQIPREIFEDIASVSINHINSEFVLKKNSTFFNVQIKYPEGTNDIEIFGLDTKSPIVFRDPELVDQEDNALTDLTVGSQVVIQSQITNSQTNTQPFAYVVQIKDEEGVTVSLSWLTGELPAQDSFRAARSWLPEESGKYTIETFLWNNLETPSPLAPSKNIEVQIIA